MKRALIGHTGFVGSNLLRGGDFTHRYNSANIAEMAGEEFDEVVCAGISAVKWAANREPERDWRQIESLLDVLKRIKAKSFTLISTIDVYPDPAIPADETHALSTEKGAPYGRHRLLVEAFVRRIFSDVLVVRLPGLFGPGLKKNIIFDLLSGNQIALINPASTFQWYPVERLAEDLRRSREARLGLVNLVPEPLPTRTILQSLFPGAEVGAESEPAPRYALTTAHADVFGGPPPFLMPRETVLAELAHFVDVTRNDLSSGRA